MATRPQKKKVQRAVSATALVALAGGISLTTYLHTRDPDPNCKTVQDMISYTRLESADLAGDDAWLQRGQGVLSGVEDYQEWAIQMQHYAAQVKDTEKNPHLAEYAQRLAADSSTIVFLRSLVLMRSLVVDRGEPPDEDPPPWMEQYNYLGYNSDEGVDALSNECPG